MSEHQTMTDAELADHIAFLKEAKEGIEKQFGGLAHGAWDTLPEIMANLGEQHLLVREYRRLNETLQRAMAEQAKRGGGGMKQATAIVTSRGRSVEVIYEDMGFESDCNAHVIEWSFVTVESAFPTITPDEEQSIYDQLRDRVDLADASIPEPDGCS